MIARRDFLIGGACAAALAGAEALRPRTEVKLLGNAQLDEILPKQFGQWHEDPTSGIIVPLTEGSLADRLYSQLFQQSFADASGLPPIMLLVAYGGAQSDQLQLHRPEACYPAVGFAITDRRLKPLKIANASAIPAIDLTAQQSGRVEDIVYWTRLGEDMPQTAGEQRMSRLYAAMRGTIGDGVLVRASTVREGMSAPQHARLSAFLEQFVMAVAPNWRKALIGTQRADSLTATRQG